MNTIDQNTERNASIMRSRLAAFAGKLESKRKDAIEYREKCGIDREWKEDEDYYLGIDDANRGEIALKSTHPDGRLIYLNEKSANNRSTAFVNITQPYVDMAAARAGDMLLPTHDKPFSLKPTPIPNAPDLLKNEDPTVSGVTQAFIDLMTKKAGLAEEQIWDWLVESRWHSEFRKVIEQTAKIGTGCLKGPFPVYRKKRKITRNELGISLTVDKKLQPASKYVDVKNIFPSPGCGEDIHNGEYLFERDWLTRRQLEELRGTGYLDAEIDAVLKEEVTKKEDNKFEIWHYYGFANHDELESAECECDDVGTIPVIVSMINDRIIKASISPSATGEFPFDIMLWQRKAGIWAGVGVARQIRTAQRMVTAGARNLMDNAGIASGPQIVLKRGAIKPADGVWEISSMKLWLVDEDADIAQVQHAITSIVIPSLQVELMNIIKLALEFAERATSMPLILQGQQGAATDTVGGMTMLQNNANTVLRRIAKIFDDNLEPHFQRYYDWLMLWGDDNERKGDFSIVTQATSAFYERDAQNQMIMQLLPLAGNPAFGLNPDKLMVEVLKMNKISPERVRFAQDELDQMKENAKKNPPVDPQIAIAQIRSQTDLQRAQINQQTTQQELQAKMQLAQSEQQHQELMAQFEEKIEVMRLSAATKQSIEKIKADLASTSAKLTVQRELSEKSMELADLNNAANRLHQIESRDRNIAITPPVEPAGRAPTGESFQR